MFVFLFFFFFFFKQKTAYEMRISDWSSDVCSSDLLEVAHVVDLLRLFFGRAADQFDRGDDVAGVFLGQEGVDADQGQRAVVLLVFVVQALVLNLAASCTLNAHLPHQAFDRATRDLDADRKSTRLNSSH